MRRHIWRNGKTKTNTKYILPERTLKSIKGKKKQKKAKLENELSVGVDLFLQVKQKGKN